MVGILTAAHLAVLIGQRDKVNRLPNLNSPAPPLRELQTVRLSGDFEGPDGRIAAGTTGTILQVFDHGHAYQIEFESPHDIPETVPEHLIVAERAAKP